MKNIVSLEGKTIVVTGGAQGIGRALVELSVELGARVVAVDKNAEGLASLDKSRGDIMTLQGDVSEPAFAADAVEQVTQAFGPIHGLVNNAGITRTAMIEKMSFVQWNEVLNVHLTGSFLWTQAVGRSMLARAKAGEKRPGAIVNISSDAGRAGTVGQINYGAAKSGMLGMTMSTAKEWAKFGIRANSICFGVVETPMTETIRGDKFRDGILRGFRWDTGPNPMRSCNRFVFCSRMPRPTSPASILRWTADFTSRFDY